MTDRPPAVEPFVMLPHRLGHALDNGEITLEEAGLVLWLMQRKDRETHKVRRTISAIEAALHWPHDRDTLVRRLRKLERLGWWTIDPVERGQHKPWTFTMSGALVLRDAGPYGGRAEVERSARRSLRRSVRSNRNGATDATEPNLSDASAADAEVDAEVVAEALREEKSLDVVQELFSLQTAAAPQRATPAPPPPAIIDECSSCMARDDATRKPVRTYDEGATYLCDDCASTDLKEATP